VRQEKSNTNFFQNEVNVQKVAKRLEDDDEMMMTKSTKNEVLKI
jgi:hypothetical protein